MNVLFVYPNFNGSEYISLGIAYLSSRLKKDGHNTKLLDLTFFRSLNDKPKIEEAISFSPDIIGISSTSVHFDYALEVGKYLKERCDAPVVLGGPQATVSPDRSISEKVIDAICIGEGEEALAALANSPERTDIPGLWLKKNGEIIKNSVAPLLEDLDKLPPPDAEIFDLDRYIQTRDYLLDFISTRGCPYSCSYCINEKYAGIYGSAWHKVRKHSVRYVVNAIKELKKNHPTIKAVDFRDDCFAADINWLKEFASVYPDEVGLDFTAHMRPELVTEEKCNLLLVSGCVAVKIGTESGADTIRRNILNRPMSDRQLENAFKIIKQAGMNAFSFNMFGLPHERPSDIMSTLKLNRKVQPDFFSFNIFQPYGGTHLRSMCIEDGLLDPNKKVPDDIHTKTILKQKQLPPIVVRFFYVFAGPIVFFPMHPIKSVLWVIKTSTKPLHGISRVIFPKWLKRYLWHTMYYKPFTKVK